MGRFSQTPRRFTILPGACPVDRVVGRLLHGIALESANSDEDLEVLDKVAHLFACFMEISKDPKPGLVVRS